MGVMPDPTFGALLKAARERRHQTQQQAADLMGVDRKTWDNWEHDRTWPRNRMGAIYEWAPELAEDTDPEEAEVRAFLERQSENPLSTLDPAVIEDMMKVLRANRAARGRRGNRPAKRAG